MGGGGGKSDGLDRWGGVKGDTLSIDAGVILPKAADYAPLSSRYFKVDPNTLQRGLEKDDGIPSGTGGGGSGGSGSVGVNIGEGFIIPRNFLAQAGQDGGGARGITGVTARNQQEAVQSDVKSFLTANGINVKSPNAVFYNDRSGQLMVRGTAQELDLVEQSVQALTDPQPPVKLEAKFADVGQAGNKALGFDWFEGDAKARTRTAGEPSVALQSSSVFQNRLGQIVNRAASVPDEKPGVPASGPNAPTGGTHLGLGSSLVTFGKAPSPVAAQPSISEAIGGIGGLRLKAARRFSRRTRTRTTTSRSRTKKPSAQRCRAAFRNAARDGSQGARTA